MIDKTSDKFLKAVQELYYWQYGRDPSSFASMLYMMFQKADGQNVRNLALGFPYEYAAWKEWYDSPHPDDFFQKYGLLRKSS